MTNEVTRRAREHKDGTLHGYTKRYRLKRLVFAEYHDSILAAIQREKSIKHWPRDWKINLIMQTNPE